MMRPEQLEQVERLWKQAMAISPEQRKSFLQALRDADEAVLAEVKALLKHSDASGDFLETPALEAAARQMAIDRINAVTEELVHQVYDDYEIISEIGRGGMGTVYLALDRQLKRTVALKVLPDYLSTEEDRLLRFSREAALLAQVNHPNVATLYDYDRRSSDGPRYLVMEYVEGETLAERLKESRLLPEEAVRIFSQIALALEAAHSKGIIHRDLKPPNIKIKSGEEVKVLDFGLAKPIRQPNPVVDVNDGRPGNDWLEDSTITQPQMILGTPGYMSPEQVRGDKTLDGRTDWWSFGCMLYEALSGRNPFRSHSNADTQAAILTQEPDWTLIPDATPPALIRLIHNCLEKDPELRVNNSADVINALNIRQPVTPRWRWNDIVPGRSFNIALSVLVLILIIGVFTIIQIWRPKQPTVVAVIAGPTTAPCKPEQSEAIVRQLNKRMEGWQGIELTQYLATPRSQQFLLIDPEQLQSALIADANTILKVAVTDCNDGTSSITYSLTRRNGETLASGSARDLSQILASIADTLMIKGELKDLAGKTDNNNYYRALALLDLYTNEAAINDAIKLLEGINPPDPIETGRVYGALGWAHLLKFSFNREAYNREQASSYRERARALAGDDPETLLFCGDVATSLGNLNLAISDFDKVLLLDKDNVKAILGLARAYEFQHNYSKAEEWYRKGLAIKSTRWELYNELGGFYFEQGEFYKAEESWTKVTALLENHTSGFNNLGSALLYQEKFKEAVVAFQEALKRRGLALTYHNLGIVYLYRGDCQTALENFRKGQSLDNSDPEYFAAIGDALSCGNTPTQEARKAYQQAIEELLKMDLSGDANYLSLLAEWYARINQRDKALQKIDEALLLEPDNYDCIVSAIKVYKLTNENQKLMQQLEKAVTNRKSLFEVKHDPILKELIQQPQPRQLIERYRSRND